jgi:hypothetical protein
VGRSTLRTLSPRRTYDFAGLRFNGALSYPIAKNVAVGPWSSGAVLVRVHARTAPLGSSTVVRVLGSLPSYEDPDEDFIEASPLASVTLGTSAPLLEVLPLDLSGASFITVAITGSTGGFLGGPPSATLSLDLVARDEN